MTAARIRLVRDYIENHPQYDLIADKYVNAPIFVSRHSIDVAKLLNGLESRCVDFTLDQILELKALILAYHISCYVGHEDRELTESFHQSTEELKSVFRDEQRVASLLLKNNLPTDKNPFSTYKMNRCEFNESEWEDMVHFANWIRYGIYLSVAPPNKVVCMKAAAILTGFRKCLVGGWAKISTAVRRRHLLYQFISGDNRQSRRVVTNKDEHLMKRARLDDDGSSVNIMRLMPTLGVSNTILNVSTDNHYGLEQDIDDALYTLIRYF